MVARIGWFSSGAVSSYWNVMSSLLTGSMRDLLARIRCCSEGSRRLGFSVMLRRVTGCLESWKRVMRLCLVVS